MKFILPCIVVTITLLGACRRPTIDGCYRAVLSKDTIKMKLKSSGDEVHGTLQYLFYEKDQNSGTVTGKYIDDSVILLDYHFTSEGQESVRQVAFMVSKNKLIEGHGPMEQKANILKFSNVDSINFAPSVVLRPVDCR